MVVFAMHSKLWRCLIRSVIRFSTRFEDGFVNLQEVLGRLAESVVNEVMNAEADRLCGATGNSRNGYRIPFPA